MSEFKKAVVRSIFKSLLLSIIPISIFCYAMLYLNIPELAIDTVSYILIGWMSYNSADSSAQIYRNNGILQGLVCGIAIFIILFAFNLMINGFVFTAALPAKLFITILCGVIGGIKGINRKHTYI